jgi:hypothetical protein
VECCHGVDGSISSINRTIPESGSGSITSVNDIGSFSPRTAIYADTEALVIPASCITDGSIDFKANRHDGADGVSLIDSYGTNDSLTVGISYNTAS